MIIFAGVDGTGSGNNDEYKKSMANSFINRLCRNEVVPFDDTFYHRGPSLLGTETRAYAEIAYSWVLGRWQSGAAKAIFLGGYSRGGAAMIEVAYWLKQKNIPVECLILFDAVDRSMPGVGGGVGGVFTNRKISDNVKQTIHPMRNILTTRSRISFQRCGSKQEDASMPHAREYFFGTHGGVGGTPWEKATLPFTGLPNPTGFIWEDGEIFSTLVTPARDSACASIVASWTYPRIIEAFFNCKKRLDQEQPIGQPPSIGIPPNIPQPGIPNGGQQRIHIVKPGDWLSKIAITYYGDMNKWPLIYEKNKAVIGPNPNMIKPGQQLIIPNL